MPDVIDMDQWPAYLDGIRREVEQMTFQAALGDIRDDLERQYQGEFSTESGPDGTPWDPWHFRRPDAPANHPTLTVSGNLSASLQGGSGNIEEIGERTLTHGTNLRYAGIHQDGATFRTGIPLISRGGGYLPVGTKITIPPRPFVGFAEDTIDKACEHVADHVVKTLKR
jgi:phage gpG-like protein